MNIPKILNPRGTNDILPEEIPVWRDIEGKAQKLLATYGYREIRTPYFEETVLFVRSLGQTSDVVQKQMLNLATTKEEGDQPKPSSLCLRPEVTASIVRAYLQNDFNKKEHLSKLYYIGPMFRGERPQKGRLRQFHQVGVEAIGPDSSIPYLDAEIIALSVRLLREFGVEGFKLKINSLGSLEDKKKLSLMLLDHLKKDVSLLCEDCQQRLARNVFRILDCKNPDCQEVIRKSSVDKLLRTEEHLSTASQEYFGGVKEALAMLGISFEVAPYLVRGLDYYTHTVFEISHEGLGSQDALGAGGRYDHLLEELGADPQEKVGGMGFALGVERILLVKRPSESVKPSSVDVFIVSMDQKGEKKAYLAAFKLLDEIRRLGISAEMNYLQGSMKSQMRLADKLGARRVIIIGEDELKEHAVTLKDMEKGTQEKVPLGNVGKILKNKINK